MRLTEKEDETLPIDVSFSCDNVGKVLCGLFSLPQLLCYFNVISMNTR